MGEAKRRGKFFISSDFIFGRGVSFPKWARENIGSRIWIVRAEYMADRRMFEYIAIGDVFDEVPDSEVAPEYELIVHAGAKTVEFKRL